MAAKVKLIALDMVNAVPHKVSIRSIVTALAGDSKMQEFNEAIAIAKSFSTSGNIHIVFKTPDNATCNQAPYNYYNTGRYMNCDASERADCEAGGADFSEWEKYGTD